MGEEKRPEWMTSIASNVNPEDYLLGRKIDKTFELGQRERTDKAREARIELIAKDRIKLSDDPILDLERRRRELKMQIIQNPVLLKHFRDRLLKETRLSMGRSADIIGDESEYKGGSSNTKERQGVRDDSSRKSDLGGHQPNYRDDGLTHQRSPTEKSLHQDTKSRDRDSRNRDSRHDSSSDRLESSYHKSRHSDSKHRHRSSFRSRSRSPCSNHRHRHRHHDRRDSSRSHSHHRQS